MYYRTALSAPGTSPSRARSSCSGKVIFASLDAPSAHERNFTRFRMAALRLWPWLASMASLTLSATFFRRSGCSNSASWGSSWSGGKIKSAIVLSKSSRKAGSLGALGASWVVAKVRAGPMLPPGVKELSRMSSISCSRSKAKWSEVSESRI